MDLGTLLGRAFDDKVELFFRRAPRDRPVSSGYMPPGVYGVWEGGGSMHSSAYVFVKDQNRDMFLEFDRRKIILEGWINSI